MSRSFMIKGASAIMLWSLFALFLVFLQARSATATVTMPARPDDSQRAAQADHSQSVARASDAQSSCPVNIGYGTTPISEDGKPTITINGGSSMTIEIEMNTGQDNPCKMKVKFTAASSGDDTSAGSGTDTKGGTNTKGGVSSGSDDESSDYYGGTP